MTHNPFNFKVGDKAYLDGVLECTIVFMTPNGMFSKITSPLYNSPYEVMTGRLLIEKILPDTPLLSRLKTHLNSITPEQFDAEIDEIIKNDQSTMLVCDDCGNEICDCEFRTCPICNGTAINGFCNTENCAYSQISADDDGLTPDELIIKDLYHEKQQHAIDFAKWLAKEWMSIWVVDRWLWEWQPERTPETIHMHLKYYTEEELYELYLKEKL